MSDFRRITLLCLKYPFSKHKMIVCSKIFLGECPPPDSAYDTDSGVTDGGQGCETPPCQAKCKNLAPTLLIFRF